MVTAPRETPTQDRAPVKSQRMENRRERERRQQLDRLARAEEARARPLSVLPDEDTDTGADDRQSRTLTLPRSGEVQADPPRFTVHAEVHRPEVEGHGVQDEADHEAVDMQEQLALGQRGQEVEMAEPPLALTHDAGGREQQVVDEPPALTYELEHELLPPLPVGLGVQQPRDEFQPYQIRFPTSSSSSGEEQDVKALKYYPDYQPCGVQSISDSSGRRGRRREHWRACPI